MNTNLFITKISVIIYLPDNIFQEWFYEKIVIFTGISLGLLSLTGCSKHEASTTQHNKDSVVTTTSSKKGSENNQSSPSTSSTTKTSSSAETSTTVIAETTPEENNMSTAVQAQLAETVQSTESSDVYTPQAAEDIPVRSNEYENILASDNEAGRTDWQNSAYAWIANTYPSYEVSYFQMVDGGNYANVFVKVKETGFEPGHAVAVVNTTTGEIHN
ncbi:MAG: hypothetical protein ACTJHK_05260 [Enterococcus viikkiensis]